MSYTLLSHATLVAMAESNKSERETLGKAVEHNAAVIKSLRAELAAEQQHGKLAAVTGAIEIILSLLDEDYMCACGNEDCVKLREVHEIGNAALEAAKGEK